MRIAIFADVQNLYYTTRQAYQRQPNYRAIWQRIATEGDIVNAFAYATHRGDDKQLGFQNALRHIGFDVKLKPYIQRSDGSAKGDWDVGITLDVMEYAAQVDKVVLLSGDGDFDLLLARVHKLHNVKTHAYGVPALTANSLIQAADDFTAIDTEFLV